MLLQRPTDYRMAYLPTYLPAYTCNSSFTIQWLEEIAQF